MQQRPSRLPSKACPLSTLCPTSSRLCCSFYTLLCSLLKFHPCPKFSPFVLFCQVNLLLSLYHRQVYLSIVLCKKIKASFHPLIIVYLNFYKLNHTMLYGMNTSKVEPTPSLLSRITVPPITSTPCFTIESPIPLASALFLLLSAV